MTTKLGFSLLFLNLILYIAATAESAVSKRSNPTEFIKSSCKSTLYQTLCVHCLIGYANSIRQSEQQLAIAALNVSLSWTQSCASFVKKNTNIRGIKPREHRAMQDCVANIDSSVDSLRQSARELHLMGNNAISEKFDWHMSNVQTWVSAALTYQSTCLDGFAGPQMDGKLKVAIRGRVISVSQVTSNALALVNRFASRHQATTLNKKP
ncbi:hypothetical protein TanjilG_21759 [Lupinus angustifolius]|uniref:Pectinesterase inhibitor domain-containing protein n=1 Tax=Lupinus angustifolius TaxID=3871 RepID=A0A1J7GZG8_LUPAN|nr:PREDICTED: 21 kDa protein-like [Lupinus angustifolius]OIV93506.1 hypothetical protein TanjilG_21759 [Lupinus angustifolius]